MPITLKTVTQTPVCDTPVTYIELDRHLPSPIDETYFSAYQFWKLQSRLTKLNNQLIKRSKPSEIEQATQ